MKMGHRRSSVRTSGTFWGKSPYADGLTYGMYGTDGDYNNSLTYMFGEMTDRFGFMVFTADRDQIKYEDGFDTDYDAEVAAESWIEQNASQYITASVASRNMIASDGQFVFYDEKFNPGNGLYLVAYYGPENDKRDSLVLELEGDDVTYLTCTVKSPDGTVIDTFTARDWESYKSSFYGEMDYGGFDFDGFLNDWLDRKYGISAGPNTASRKLSNNRDYEFYGMRHAPIYRSEYNGGNLDGVAFYGPKDDIDNSIDIEIVGDDQIGYECEPITPMGHILDAFYADTWSDIPNAIVYEIDAQHFKECLDKELYLFERDGTWIKDTRILSASREPRSAKVHKTAKRKMTMKEKLALINEDKLDEEDDPINPFF